MISLLELIEEGWTVSLFLESDQSNEVAVPKICMRAEKEGRTTGLSIKTRGNQSVDDMKKDMSDALEILADYSIRPEGKPCEY